VCTDIIFFNKLFATMTHAIGLYMGLDIFHDWGGSQRHRLDLAVSG
jgi:hypothetical protein